MSDDSKINTELSKPLVGVITSFREDITQPIEWEVQQTVGEHDSRVDFAAGILAVPLTGDGWSQRLSIRKVVESRVSPTSNETYTHVANEYKHLGITESVLRLAEKARINAIAQPFIDARGIEEESDTSYKVVGKRLATINSPASWDQAIEFTVQNAGTKAFNSFASGVRSVNPEWSKSLRNLSKRITSRLNDTPANLGDTSPYRITDKATMPRGFKNTINLASTISEYVSSGYRAPSDVKIELGKRDDNRAASYGEAEISEEGKLSVRDAPLSDDLPDDFEFPTDEAGTFAELMIDETLLLPIEVDGYMKRRRRPAQFGRSLGNPSRILTDPERRIFTNKVRVKGGIVVIDISGSMSLTQEDIESIVEAAPASIILAYSYCGSEEPNAWILANRGWRVREIPNIGGRGNGVDGPALSWALRHRKPGEPIVWVSDGYVTTRNDGRNNTIVLQCAQLVKKHKIIMIPSVEEAVAMFKANKLINKPAGPIRDALLGRL